MADCLSDCATDEEDIGYAKYRSSSDDVGENSRGETPEKCSQRSGGCDKFLKESPDVSRVVILHAPYRRPKPSADWKGS